METYTEEYYARDYARHLDTLTTDEESQREWLGGVFVGLLTREEYEERDAGMIRDGYSSMSDGSYEEYLKRCRVNTENVHRQKEESQRHLRMFFAAEQLGIPHHGAADERL